MTDNTTNDGPEPEPLEGPGVELPTGDDQDGTKKPNGLGPGGTVPNAPDGVAAGLSDAASHCNPEEDDSDDNPDT